jgi:hypothetical protein
MSPNRKSASDTLLTRLHGKSSMSEVLMIERQRLLEQAAEEMRVQLAPPALAAQPVPFEPKHLDTYQPSKQPERVVQEGVSRFSRFVGEDLSEYAGIIVHSEGTVMAARDWPIDSYYMELSNTLAFSSERQLLLAICRLTVGCESFSCRVTLDALSAASGIRNGKTLRKWLADLQKRRYIRYIPVHGDLRGSVIEITPPEEIRGSIERNWRNSRRKA